MTKEENNKIWEQATGAKKSSDEQYEQATGAAKALGNTAGNRVNSIAYKIGSAAKSAISGFRSAQQKAQVKIQPPKVVLPKKVKGTRPGTSPKMVKRERSPPRQAKKPVQNRPAYNPARIDTNEFMGGGGFGGSKPKKKSGSGFNPFEFI